MQLMFFQMQSELLILILSWIKFIKRTTLKKYLHGESSATNPPTEFPRDVYLMDRIKGKTKTAVQIECVAPFDLQE